MVAEILLGHTIVGSSSSVTVISCGQLLELPAASVTTQITVVVPTGKLDPGGTPVGTVVIPEHVSAAVGNTFTSNMLT